MAYLFENRWPIFSRASNLFGAFGVVGLASVCMMLASIDTKAPSPHGFWVRNGVILQESTDCADLWRERPTEYSFSSEPEETSITCRDERTDSYLGRISLQFTAEATAPELLMCTYPQGLSLRQELQIVGRIVQSHVTTAASMRRLAGEGRHAREHLQALINEGLPGWQVSVHEVHVREF